jgi:hypothetical protein
MLLPASIARLRCEFSHLRQIGINPPSAVRSLDAAGDCVMQISFLVDTSLTLDLIDIGNTFSRAPFDAGIAGS